jgi:hypothetical protein
MPNILDRVSLINFQVTHLGLMGKLMSHTVMRFVPDEEQSRIESSLKIK